jgi:N-acetylglucosaminyl-diphospho-decaprenol L-rhamnosyltransferase
MISVLTVNFRSAGDLTLLAESIREYAGGLDVELIVANHSPDEPLTLPADRSPSVTVLPSTNRGFAAGVNLAFRQARGEIIMIANPDLRITAATLPRAVEYLDGHPQVGIVLPLLRHPSGEVQDSVRRFYTWATVLYARSPLRWLGVRPAFFRRYLYEDLDRTAPTPVDWGLGAAMFLRRADGDADGIFDERFFLYFEDVDLCLRMWRRGRAVMYCPHIECLHAHRRSSRNPLSPAGWWHWWSLCRFIVKHHGLPQRAGKGGSGGG